MWLGLSPGGLQPGLERRQLPSPPAPTEWDFGLERGVCAFRVGGSNAVLKGEPVSPLLSCGWPPASVTRGAFLGGAGGFLYRLHGAIHAAPSWLGQPYGPCKGSGHPPHPKPAPHLPFPRGFPWIQLKISGSSLLESVACPTAPDPGPCLVSDLQVSGPVNLAVTSISGLPCMRVCWGAGGVCLQPRSPQLRMQLFRWGKGLSR